MSVSRYGSRDALMNSETASRATAKVDVVRSIVGRTRFLYEMASGGTAVAGDDPVAPKNPSGDVGCNHSGPPFGAAMRHCVWWASGIKAASSTWVQNSNVTPAAGIFTGTGTVSSQQIVNAYFYLRPFANWTINDKVAPYARLRGSYSAYATGNCSMTCKVLYAPVGGGEATGWETLFTDSITTTDTQFLSSAFMVKAVPGWNNIQLCFYGSNTEQITITSIALNCYNKTSISI